MVEFIRTDPAMAAFRRTVAAGDLARRQSEIDDATGLRNAAAEADVINASRLDRNIAAAGLRVPVRTSPPVTPAVPAIPQPPASGVPVADLRGGGGGEAILVPPPAAATGLRTAGPSARDRLAEAYMNTPGYRAQGAEMMVGAEDATLAREEAELKQFLTMAAKDPQAAIAWSQGNGIPIPPEFLQVLSDRGRAAEAEQLFAQAERYFPGGHNIKKRVQWYLDQLQGLKDGMAKPAPGGPTPAGGAGLISNGQPEADILPDNAPSAAPTTKETSTGNIQWNSATDKWEPMMEGGKQVQPPKDGAGAPKVSKVLLTTDGGATAIMSDGSKIVLDIKVLNEAKSNPMTFIVRMTDDIYNKEYPSFEGTYADAQRQAIELYQNLEREMAKAPTPATGGQPKRIRYDTQGNRIE